MTSTAAEEEEAAAVNLVNSEIATDKDPGRSSSIQGTENISEDVDNAYQANKTPLWLELKLPPLVTKFLQDFKTFGKPGGCDRDDFGRAMRLSPRLRNVLLATIVDLSKNPG